MASSTPPVNDLLDDFQSFIRANPGLSTIDDDSNLNASTGDPTRILFSEPSESQLERTASAQHPRCFPQQFQAANFHLYQGTTFTPARMHVASGSQVAMFSAVPGEIHQTYTSDGTQGSYARATMEPAGTGDGSDTCISDPNTTAIDQVVMLNPTITQPFCQSDQARYCVVFALDAPGGTHQTVSLDMCPNPTVQSGQAMFHPSSTHLFHSISQTNQYRATFASTYPLHEQGPHTPQPVAPNHLTNTSTGVPDENVSSDIQHNNPIPVLRTQSVQPTYEWNSRIPRPIAPYSAPFWNPHQPPTAQSSAINHHRCRTQESHLELTAGDTSRIIDHAREDLFNAMVTGEVILISERENVIAAILNKVAISVLGRKYRNSGPLPPKIRKEVVCPVNDMLHAWKNHATSLALTSLLPAIGQPVLSHTDIANEANRILVDFSYLRDSPSSEYFTAECFVHSNIICAYQPNGTARPTRQPIHFGGGCCCCEHTEILSMGRQQTQSVSGETWKADYYGVHTLIKEIRRDVGREVELDRVQAWVMEQGVHLAPQATFGSSSGMSY
ncbi:hypothetical protein V8E55_006539 [Tylopilus felleus]